MRNMFWETPKTLMSTCARASAVSSAVSQAILEIKAQGGFPFGGQAAREISLCGGVWHLGNRVARGISLVGVLRSEPARGISVCECEKFVKVCKFYAGHAHELFEVLCGGCLKKFQKVS